MIPDMLCVHELYIFILYVYEQKINPYIVQLYVNDGFKVLVGVHLCVCMHTYTFVLGGGGKCTRKGS